MLSRLTLAICLTLLSASTVLAADAAYERDLVDRAQATFAPSGPLVVDGIRVHRLCGSPLLLEIRLNWHNLTESTRAQLAAIVQFERPILPEFYDTPDGNFRIHFARTGSDSVNMSFGVGAGNVPIYILNCAEILEEVTAKEIDTLGFRFPVSDAESRPAEDPRFDIYFQNLGLYFYGQTNSEDTIYNGPGNPKWVTSYMFLQSDYTQLPFYENRPFDAMAVTVAHEFHHASQWTYDALESEIRHGETFPWWLEASATGIEEVVYDDVNDYYVGPDKGYLRFWFDYPDVSLRAFSRAQTVDGLHPYASCIWPIYLAQKFGPEILREIWDECGEVDGFNTFAAYDSVLTRRATTFRDAWSEFLVWNYFTGARAASWGYEEAASYPAFDLPNSLRYSVYPVADTSSAVEYPKSPDELAAAYLRFDSPPSDTATTFKILVEAHDPSNFEEWTVVTAGLLGLSEPEIVIHDIFSTIEASAWNSYDEILVIATPFKPKPTQDVFDRRLGFRFDVADTLDSGGTVTAIRKVYSNPLVLTAGSEDVFRIDVSRGESVTVTMRIYTVDGKEVRGGEAGDDDESNNLFEEAGRSNAEMRWGGTTSAGVPVATGVYLALVQIGDRSEVIKVAVKNRTQ